MKILLRCDLRSEYGVNIDDLEKKSASWVDVAELTVGLPPGARIHKGWSQETHLLADQVDLLLRLNWLQGIATSAALDPKDKKILNKPPTQLKRPGDEEKKLVFTDPAKLAEMLQTSKLVAEAKAEADGAAVEKPDSNAWANALRNVKVPEETNGDAGD